MTKVTSIVGKKNGQSVYAIEGLGFWTAPAFIVLLEKGTRLYVRYRQESQKDVFFTTSIDDVKGIRGAIKAALEAAEKDGGIYPVSFKRDWFKSEPTPGHKEGWRISVPAVAAKVLGLGDKNVAQFFPTKKSATIALKAHIAAFKEKAPIAIKTAVRISKKSPV